MKKNICIQLADLKCAFENFGSDSFWDEWQWKLDAFAIHSTESSTDFIITQKEHHALPDSKQGSLVYTQNSGFFEWHVYHLDSGEYLWLYVRRSTHTAVLAYTTSKNWDRITLISDTTDSCMNAAFTRLNILIPGLLLRHNTLTFHGALVEYNNYSFAICADSGVGKTTHARLWRDIERALIINGDRMVCRPDDSESLSDTDRMHPWRSYSLPWSGTSGECINRTNPLKAIVILERGTENIALRVRGITAFRLLFSHLLYPFWDQQMTEAALTKLNQLLGDIPVLRLQCRPDAEAVAVLKAALEKL